jgi:GT2 family glycosyltransferase
MRQVSVVIANWNGKHLLERFLPSVLAALREGDEVIVVDNGSRDGSVTFLCEHFPSVRLVCLPKNYGFSVANNLGVLVARNDIVVLLNNDMQPQADFLAPLLEHFDDPRVFAVGCKLLHPDGGCVDANRTRIVLLQGMVFFTGEWDAERLNHCQTPEEQALVQGGGAAFDRRKFLALGGFDPIFSPAHAEDFDLCLRALLRGWRIVYEPRSLVWHLGRQTTRRGRAEQFLRLTFAHYWLFNFLHAPSLLWLAWQCGAVVKQVVGEVAGGEPAIFRRAMATVLRKWWKVTRRRWQCPPASVEQFVALLQRFYHRELLETLPSSLPPLPDKEFVLLLTPIVDEERTLIRRAVQAVRARWQLPVAVIARPQQADALTREGIADAVITFWAGAGNSHFNDYRALLQWLQRAPCRAAVFVPQVRSVSKGRFLVLGGLLSCPLWEWRGNAFRPFPRRLLWGKLVLQGAMATVWLFWGLLWAGAMLATEVVAAILRRVAPVASPSKAPLAKSRLALK